MPTTEAKRIDVAVGVVFDAHGRVLLAQRQHGQHLAGLWEFPGGKQEPGETLAQTLSRELAEELGITVTHAAPWKDIEHDYPECSVRLHFWQVTAFDGEAAGLLGQTLAWVLPRQLLGYPLPSPSRPIAHALSLPDVYAIVDDHVFEDWLGAFTRRLDQGYRLLQARLKNTPPDQALYVVRQARKLADAAGAWLLINSAAPTCVHGLGHGLHLTARDLDLMTRRPDHCQWLAASCHSTQELAKAQSLGVDFAVLGPVNASLTHPDRPGIGWAAFASLTRASILPLYALGGMTVEHGSTAKQHGGQGIAAIRSLT
ncbi:MAG: Nudix family hydrolase [Methylococcales bacterium]|nr:Nudix family hydrolase [Methylococcales bacterium]